MEMIYSKNDIEKASKFIIESCNSNHLLFKGMVGAGKTTLIKEVCKELKERSLHNHLHIYLL